MRDVLIVLAYIATASLDLLFLAHDTLNILGVTGPSPDFEPIVVLNLLVIMIYLLSPSLTEKEK